jgi:hypothetical protein
LIAIDMPIARLTMLAVDRRRVISSALADGRAPRAGADNICDRMNRMRAKSTTAQDDEHHPERVDGGTGREARERRPHRANELDDRAVDDDRRDQRESHQLRAPAAWRQIGWHAVHVVAASRPERLRRRSMRASR